ncbi:hypothetical protein AVEN_156599-1 [Araneus ventricosus]|uniref:Uncharacterized protein n=1 Tax=Araneus ventricosus TaxID=182803 RepID=A0A4Y2EVI0_ARAVE|nr:hypothetical protein AVEN_156599-1 [Araneus ventricosus]
MVQKETTYSNKISLTNMICENNMEMGLGGDGVQTLSDDVSSNSSDISYSKMSSSEELDALISVSGSRECNSRVLTDERASLVSGAV